MNSLLLKALVNIPEINPGTDIADIIFNNIQLDLMRNIKKAFDPKSILNPGKIWPET